MIPSRRTQPYRRGVGRRRSKALGAMLRGRSATGRNPMDVRRALARKARR